MLRKKTEKGLCPFRNLKECSDKCVFYRKGMRYSEKDSEPIPFEDCAVNIIADNVEALHNRSYMMQKEIGDTKNIIALKTMVDLNAGNHDTLETLRRHLNGTVIKDDTKKLK